MNERENFAASEEARRDVLSRAGHTPTSGDPVRRLVDAAIYRETHHSTPPPGQDGGTAPEETPV
ncbi:MAG TPA: hypothetical protein VFT95_07975 [Micromonosporaceae bacterium]|nr:hypothetical protein [Micromonosporaceae bacterium]